MKSKSTRAIHLELVTDLSADAFIAALKRFISRRGKCSDIYSDCGSNFVGAKRFLNLQCGKVVKLHIQQGESLTKEIKFCMRFANASLFSESFFPECCRKNPFVISPTTPCAEEREREREERKWRPKDAPLPPSILFILQSSEGICASRLRKNGRLVFELGDRSLETVRKIKTEENGRNSLNLTTSDIDLQNVGRRAFNVSCGTPNIIMILK
ncbi:reverse transcriptase [Caerostris extrusa]|uniref:Reverse transcriptase n=1 Tax=Caerostris extrusa TaxID=172846 RepID=A0AAV4Y7B5_CAEEX|nr:reverse transcriptase [Caerostris extrusa]